MAQNSIWKVPVSPIRKCRRGQSVNWREINRSQF